MKLPPSVRGPGARFLPLALVLLSLFFAGCVSTNRTALAPEASGRIKSVKATVLVAQPEIAADIETSNVAAAAGGGLIAALVDVAIDAHRSKKAEEAITPLRDALVDFNVAECLRATLEKGLGAQPPLAVTAVNLDLQMKPDAMRKSAETGGADAMLFISADYRLTPACDRIRVMAKVTLLPKTGTADGKPLYENQFTTFRAVPSVQAGAIQKWSDNKGALASDALQSCFAELAEMIVFDVPQGPEVNLLPKEKLTTSAPPVAPAMAAGRFIQRGAVEKKHGERTWVRLQTGELSSVD